MWKVRAQENATEPLLEKKLNDMELLANVWQVLHLQDCHFVVHTCQHIAKFWVVFSKQARFQLCCKNAMDAALQLASFCSQESVEVLEKAYRNLCNAHDSDFFDPDVHNLDPDESSEVQPIADVSCSDLVSQVAIEGKFIMEDPGQEMDHEAADAEDLEMKRIPDGEQIKKLVDKDNVMEPFRTETSRSPKGKGEQDPDFLPSTLREVFDMKCVKVDKSNIWNPLFRLAVRLRCGKGGMDSIFVRNHRSCRRASKALNWHQQLTTKCSM